MPNQDRHVKAITLSLYRQRPCLRSIGACRRASVRHRSDSGARAVQGSRSASACNRWGGLPDHQAEGVGRDGTARMEKATVDFHEAIGQDVLEEPAEKFHDVELSGAWARTAGLREGKVPVRSVSETMRLLEMATLKTYGARYVKDVWPLGVAWLWTFQWVCQTSGSICARSPA